MRISGNVSGVTGIYTNDKKVSKVENTNKVSATKDDIKISNVGKDYAIALNAMKNIPDIRQDRVDDISAKLERNEYNVPSEDIAEKIMNEIFDIQA